jgi:alpha/beta superfamily hydrolase
LIRSINTSNTNSPNTSAVNLQSDNKDNNSASNTKDNILMINNNKPLLIKEKNVVIICGPNAACYEILAYTDRWIEYYLENGINVFLWNYRGYGESKGKVDFENLKKDAECVADFLKKYYKFSRIGVHGFSIGGVAACHLAS